MAADEVTNALNSEPGFKEKLIFLFFSSSETKVFVSLYFQVNKLYLLEMLILILCQI